MADPIDKLAAGDLIGFIVDCLLTAFVEPQYVYGLITFFVSVAIYNRTQTIYSLIVIWLLVGSALIVAMPGVSIIAILLVMMGLGALIFKVYMGLRRGE